MTSVEIVEMDLLGDVFTPQLKQFAECFFRIRDDLPVNWGQEAQDLPITGQGLGLLLAI